MGFEAKLRKELPSSAEGVLWPAVRLTCVGTIAEDLGIPVAEAVELERGVASLSNGDVTAYMPILQHLERGGSAEAAAAAALAAPAPAPSAETATLAKIHSMSFACTVAGATGGGRLCPKCHSDDLLAEGRQTRSADEGQTVFWACKACGHSFR